MRKWLNLLAVLLLALMVAAPADALGKRKKGSQLEAMQLAYATAIRWGEFEEAWQLVDPAYREAHPMTELEFERYKQVEISGYTDKNSSAVRRRQRAAQRGAAGDQQAQHGRTQPALPRRMALGPGSQALVAGGGTARSVERRIRPIPAGKGRFAHQTRTCPGPMRQSRPVLQLPIP